MRERRDASVGDRLTDDQSRRRLLLEALRHRSGAAESEIVSATNLFDDGILTSLSLAYVVMDLEAKLGLELMRDLYVPDWKSVNSITDVLIRKGAGS